MSTILRQNQPTVSCQSTRIKIFLTLRNLISLLEQQLLQELKSGLENREQQSLWMLQKFWGIRAVRVWDAAFGKAIDVDNVHLA